MDNLNVPNTATDSAAEQALIHEVATSNEDAAVKVERLTKILTDRYGSRGKRIKELEADNKALSATLSEADEILKRIYGVLDSELPQNAAKGSPVARWYARVVGN